MSLTDDLSAIDSGAGSLAIGRAAIRALRIELMLYPKPGLVSPVDSGAHDDMDFSTFLPSLAVLQPYFVEVAAAGAQNAPFGLLRGLGWEAERQMLIATGGVNTHRGAIFSLGLLAAAAGWRRRRGLDVDGATLARTAISQWGDGLREAGRQATDSHGDRVIRRYNVRGARDEALAGFPILVRAALPALEGTLQRLACPERASIQCLFIVMSELQDTNLLHRGGAEGLSFVQMSARRFLDAGGVYSAHWRDRALRLHGDCVALRLSPGGSADCLAAAWFVHELQQ